MSGVEASKEIKYTMLQGLADATTVCEQTSEEIQNNPKLSIKKTNPKLFTSKVSSTKKKKSVQGKIIRDLRPW